MALRTGLAAGVPIFSGECTGYVYLHRSSTLALGGEYPEVATYITAG
jgi:hypothetical protein